MKGCLVLFVAIAVTIVAPSTARFQRGTMVPPYINRPTMPKPRFRREANPQDHGTVSISQTKPLSGPERRPSYQADYQHNIWKGKNGEITAGGGAQKLPGHRWEPQVGVQGRWRFRREASPQKSNASPQKSHGSITGTFEKPMSGPERRPSYKLDYQHNIWQGKNGQVSAGGGIQKFPGRKVEPQIGIQGRWRF